MIREATPPGRYIFEEGSSLCVRGNEIDQQSSCFDTHQMMIDGGGFNLLVSRRLSDNRILFVRKRRTSLHLLKANSIKIRNVPLSSVKLREKIASGRLSENCGTERPFIRYVINPRG